MHTNRLLRLNITNKQSAIEEINLQHKFKRNISTLHTKQRQKVYQRTLRAELVPAPGSTRIASAVIARGTRPLDEIRAPLENQRGLTNMGTRQTRNGVGFRPYATPHVRNFGADPCDGARQPLRVLRLPAWKQRPPRLHRSPHIPSPISSLIAPCHPFDIISC